MKLRDVPEVLHIDKSRLDHELIAQAGLVYEVGTQQARSVSKRDGMKEELRAFEASVNQEYRKTATKNKEKVTEKSLDLSVMADTRVIEAKKAFADSCDSTRRWDAAFEAIRARGFALHKLVDFEIATGAAIAGQSEKSRPLSRSEERRRDHADDEVQLSMKARRTKRKRQTMEDD